jgi:hypothetical protein
MWPSGAAPSVRFPVGPGCVETCVCGELTSDITCPAFILGSATSPASTAGGRPRAASARHSNSARRQSRPRDIDGWVAARACRPEINLTRPSHDSKVSNSSPESPDSANELSISPTCVPPNATKLVTNTAATPKPCPANSYSAPIPLRTSGSIKCEQYHKLLTSISYSFAANAQLEDVSAQVAASPQVGTEFTRAVNSGVPWRGCRRPARQPSASP